MINQLFKKKPNEEQLGKILNCFNLKSIDDDRTITFTLMNYHNTIDKLYEILDILMEIYLPCKWYYINNLNNKKCITILRQILKLYNRLLLLTFIVENKTKIISYNIQQLNKKKIFIQKDIKISF